MLSFIGRSISPSVITHQCRVVSSAVRVMARNFVASRGSSVCERFWLVNATIAHKDQSERLLAVPTVISVHSHRDGSDYSTEDRTPDPPSGPWLALTVPPPGWP